MVCYVETYPKISTAKEILVHFELFDRYCASVFICFGIGND